MCTVLHPDRRTFRSGMDRAWLIRHAAEVTGLWAYSAHFPERDDDPAKVDRSMWLEATMTDGRIFATHFDRPLKLRKWLQHPRLVRLPLKWREVTYC